jgi:hypothetical protein
VLGADLSGTRPNYQNEIQATNGLVSYWKMDNNWNDSKGSNDGTATGASFATARYGTFAGTFDGSSYVDVGSDSSLDLTSQITAEAWINTSDPKSIQFIAGRADTGYKGWRLAVEGDTVTFVVSNGSEIANASAPYIKGTWAHVVGVYDGAFARIYVNGIEATPAPLTGDINYGDLTNTWIGQIPGQGGNSDRYFNGSIDEFAIYNRALSGNEVLSHLSDDYVLNGTWQSAPIDLIWNSGWSVAGSFLADMNIPAGTSVNFEMRASESLGTLSSATYQSLTDGNPASAVFSADLSTDGVPSQAGRYVQIRATLSSNDISVTPTITNVTLNYLKDSSLPFFDISNNAVSLSNFQKDALNKIWTRDSGDNIFSWNSSAVDNATDDSGMLGYCVYMGTAIDGDPENINPASGLLNQSTQSGSVYASGVPNELVDSKLIGEKCNFIVRAQPDITSLDLYNTIINNNGLKGLDRIASSVSPYYFNVKAIDKAGNVSSEMLRYSFYVDDQNPESARYVSAPGDFVSYRDVTISWPLNAPNAATDNFSGVLGYQYRIGDNQSCDNGSQWYGSKHTGSHDDIIPFGQGSYTMQSEYDLVDPAVDGGDFKYLNEGLNYVCFRVFDNAGNRTESDQMRAVIKINTEAPSAPRDLVATAYPIDVLHPQESKENKYSFSWTKPENFIGSENKLNYCYTVNALPFYSIVDGAISTNCTFAGPGVTHLDVDAYATQPGENTLYVVAKSENEKMNPAVYVSSVFFYSGDAPGIPLNADVADISVKSTKNWRLVVSWDPPTIVGAGVSSYKIFRNEQSTTTACSTGAEVGSTSGTSYTDTGLTQKPYFYCIKACDSANSCGASSTTVSGTPTGKFVQPANLTDGPSANSITTSKAVISWSTDRKSDSKISYGKDSKDYYKEEPSNSDQVTGHEISLNNLSPGTEYFYRARWTDEDGNTGLSEEKSFKTEPAPKIKDAQTENVGISDANIKFTSKGASKVKVYYGQTEDFGATKELSTSKSESSYVVQLENLNDNTKYYFKINTFDSEDQEYEGTTLDFTTLPRPRISNVEIQPIKDSAQPGVQVIWQSNTEISSIVTFFPLDNPADKQNQVQVDLISGQHESTIMNLKPLTTYQITVKGVDKVGNEASADSITFTTALDTRPPQISQIVVEGSGSDNQTDKLSQLAVSWNTDESATSQVEFGEGVGSQYSQRTQEDANLTTNHLVILSGLTASKVYHLRIVSKDQAGNISNSMDTVSVTPKLVDSAFELVVGNLMQAFGFLKGFQN